MNENKNNEFWDVAYGGVFSEKNRGKSTLSGCLIAIIIIVLMFTIAISTTLLLGGKFNPHAKHHHNKCNCQ